MSLKKITKKSICLAAAIAVIATGCSPSDYQPHQDPAPSVQPSSDPAPGPSNSSSYTPGLMAIGERYDCWES